MNGLITRTRIRLRQLLQRGAVRGVSPWKLLLLELPRVVAARGYARVTALLYAGADRLGQEDRRIRKLLASHAGTGGKVFYIIVVPRVLHFLLPAVRLVERKIDIVFIGNGLSNAEKRVLQREFPAIPVLSLRTLPGSSWPHGNVLSLLLRTSPGDFGIIDHDFYLFDHAILDQLQFGTGEYAIGLTRWHNRATGLTFPLTHFLYLKVEPLRAIMQRYGVDARLYKRIPGPALAALHGAGLSLNNPPKEYQTFFDSFLLLAALAMVEGYTARIPETAAGGFEHVGGTSMGSLLTKGPVQQYTNASFLALLEDNALAARYVRNGISPAASAHRFVDLADPETVTRIDALIVRLGKCRRTAR